MKSAYAPPGAGVFDDCRAAIGLIASVAFPRARARAMLGWPDPVPKDVAMSETEVIKPPLLTLPELARNAVLETSNIEEAAVTLLKKVRGNEQFIRQMLKCAAADLVAKARMQIRSALSHEHLGGAERGLKSHVAALKGRAALFDWKLPQTDKSIGDATIIDLSDAVDWHAGRADFETARSEMYRKVQERLARSNKPTVREAMTEDELAALMTHTQVEE
jgi:hypothetical protein